MHQRSSWEGRYTGTIPLSRPQKPGSSGTENRQVSKLLVFNDQPTGTVISRREPSGLRTSLAAVDGHDVCSAWPCPLRSTSLAVAAFMTVGSKSFSSAHSTGSNLRSPEGFRLNQLPSHGLALQPRRFTGVWPLSHATASWSHR